MNQKASQRSKSVAWTRRAMSAWDGRATDWNAKSTQSAASPDREDEIARIAALLDLGSGSMLLDVGCGAGHWTIALARSGCNAFGIDLSAEMAQVSRANFADAGSTIGIAQASVEHLPVSNGAFDAIVARVMLQFVPDVQQAIDEIGRVLSPSGRLYVSVPGSLSPIYARSVDRFVNPGEQILNYILPWELEELLESCGWTILDQWGGFGPNSSGIENLTAGLDHSLLPHRLQQASATSWSFVACK